MSGSILITRAGPLATVQDAGRFGMLMHGVAASGPMDAGAFNRTLALLGAGGSSAMEFTQAGIAFTVEGTALVAAFDGGAFKLKINGRKRDWSTAHALKSGDKVDVAPGAGGNYGYVRFDQEIDVAPLLGSRATNSTVGLGGFKGRALAEGDRLTLLSTGADAQLGALEATAPDNGPIHVIWGIHADLFAPVVRDAFLATSFRISPRLDRMGVRLEDPAGVFAKAEILSLVSDAIVPGDIQILGDGTPIVLMRDHQPTGGYPRIATVISADLDRFAQLRPGTPVSFAAVSLPHAAALRTRAKP